MRTMKKGVLSALDVAVVVNELRRFILNSYVDNVYEDVGNKFLIKLRTLDEDVYLLLEPSRRIHITKHTLQPTSKGKVVMMRKFIRGLRLSDISQIDFERIVKMVFEGRDSKYIMYVELIPRGILTLTAPNDKVLVVSNELKVKDRVVCVGRSYKLPPTYRDFRSLSVREWFLELRKSGDLIRGLVRGLGIPPEVVNEVLANYDVSSLMGNSTITEELVNDIRNRIINFIADVVNNPKPVIIADSSGNYVTFLPFKPSKIAEGSSVIEFPTLNDAIDEYFLKYSVSELTSSYSDAIKGELQRLEKIAENLREELTTFKSKFNELNHIYSVLISHYNVLDEIRECSWNMIKNYGWDYVIKCGVREYDQHRGLIKVYINNIPIELDVRKDLKEYLIKLKAQISDYEDKIKRAEEVLNDILRKRQNLYIESTLLVESPLVRRVDWFDKFHWILTSEGFLAIGGRNAEQNEKIVRKYLGDDDIFMHADVRGASAFVIKTGGKKPSEKSLYEVATLAASYSRAWKESFGCVDVFWVYGNQVSKKAPAGEYLTTGAFMIYGRKNIIKGVRLELAIGVLVEGNCYKIIVGPEDYIMGKCRTYALIQPGTESKESVAKLLKDFFIRNERGLKYLTLNEVVERIPGSSRVIKLNPS